MLRAVTPSAWTATVESGTDGFKGAGAARSLSSGSDPREAAVTRSRDGYPASGPKHDEERLDYLTPEIKALRASQLERVEALQKRTERIIPVEARPVSV
jgi:hypothetical protein